MNILIATGSLAHSLLHISNGIPFCDVGSFALFSRASDVTAFMYNELKHSANQRPQTNSESISSSAQRIKQLKPTWIKTEQTQSKSSSSSKQQIEEVTRTERSRHSKRKRSSAQYNTEVKRTAYHKGQAHSKWKRSSEQQMEEVKRTANQRYQAHSETNKTLRALRYAPESQNPNYICWTNARCPAKQNTYGPVKRTE